MEPATILVADDEALLLLGYEDTLADAGFRVVPVTSGRQALAFLRSADSAVDAVVTDIRFGELADGWDIALVAREIHPDMPVVYISGHAADEWQSRGVENSILLEKPFPFEELVTAVSQLLQVSVPLLGTASDTSRPVPVAMWRSMSPSRTPDW
ncbi:response regulator (plasmid) [Ensifer sp. D2-11]